MRRTIIRMNIRMLAKETRHDVLRTIQTKQLALMAI